MTKEELLYQKKKIDEELNSIDPNRIAFTVDANIINRLGKELVGRAETAVSELVKNAYDADANVVQLEFISSNTEGGSLIIIDDGHGMDKEQLIKGFMKLSSTSKIHEPISPKYKRRRAGRKGIGRFATQFLGEKLTIFTQTENEDYAIKVIINWNDYEMDKDLTSIENQLEIIPKQKQAGTTLFIENLRQPWSDAQIKRVFRYVSELLQPNYLSKKSYELNIDHQNDDYFLVECYRTENGLKTAIVDLNKVLKEKSLAVIEGFVDDSHDGYFGVKSPSFNIDDFAEPISSSDKGGDMIEKFTAIKNVHFKAFYFIYDRHEYYGNGISKIELNNIEAISETSSGIRMYRNGFRVLPYGEIGDDWLGLDRKRRRIDIELENEDVITFNIPYTNKNFFGFVELIDYEGVFFEETASREGLIENTALYELKDFIRKSIIAGIKRISPYIFKAKQKREEKRIYAKTIREKLQGVQTKINGLQNNKNDSEKSNSENIKDILSDIDQDLINILDELAMLRILATLGLTIGEFTHEIIQFPIFFTSKLYNLYQNEANIEKKESVKEVLDKVKHLETYTNYFNDAVSRNSNRDLEIIELRQVVKPFFNSMEWDFKHENILVSTDIVGYDLFTCPMHPSEWHSILLNLYTNAKKALRRAKQPNKKINIKCGKDINIVYLEFSDNGDGVPKDIESRIFDPFFTTSTPPSSENDNLSTMAGSGLGLKILKDIISEYGGEIFLTSPPKGFSTCFRIEVPKATEEQILNAE